MAETYNVYFGIPGNLSLISAGQSGTEVDVPYLLDYNTQYAWRVDAINEFGTTTGDTWTFTTDGFSPPLPTGLSMADGTPSGGTTGTANGENGMITMRRLVVAAANKIYYET